jgi:hypothetical protein
MQAFLRRHAPTILLGHGTAIALLTTSMMVSVPKAILYITPAPESVVVGDRVTLSIQLNAKVPVNAIGTTLVIPPEVEIVTISKEDSFIDLWTEDLILRQTAGELRFSGGTLDRGGLTEVHTALTLTLEATQPGEAVFSFKDTEVRAHDGTGDLVPTELRTLSLSITEATNEKDPGETHSIPPPMSADLDKNGSVTLADMSILMMQLFGQYDAQFDLNRDGVLSIADLSVFLLALQGR